VFDETMSKRNMVVVHYKDARLYKGYTHDFNPVRETFHLTSELDEDKGTIHEVKIADLKAVFFVKTLEGNLDYKEKKRFDEADTSQLRGMKIKVVFHDGEILRGVSLGYSKGRKGFFVIPVDPDSNNERIWVVADAVREVGVGSAAEK
jgi:hypothetical protein